MRSANAPPSQLLDYSRTVFAYQLMGGLSHDLSPKVAVTAQYRWFDAGTIKGHDSRGERATHRLTLLPGVSRRSRLLLGPLQGLVVDA